MNRGTIILYDDKPSIEIRLDNDTIWLNQRQMAELFDKDSDTIGLHLKNIFKTKELDKKVTTEKYSVVQKEGNRNVRRTVKKSGQSEPLKTEFFEPSKKPFQIVL